MMQNSLKFYINGEWVDPQTPRTLDVINPATEQPMGQISLGSASDVDLAVARASANTVKRVAQELGACRI